MVKKLLRVLAGEAVSPPPVWLMRQAGRYLPEYRALRSQAPNFIKFCLSPEQAAEVTLQPIRRFHMDAAILFADILLVPHALGQKVWFETGEGPRLEPVRDIAALKKLSYDAGKLAPVMQTIKLVREDLPADVTLIGFAGAPWTVATYMIEGQGGTGHELSRTLARDDEFFGALMDMLVDATSAYLIAQGNAGAEALQLFESWAGSVPPELFERAVLNPTARIIKKVKAAHPAIPIIGFPRGAGDKLAAYATTGVDGIGLDQMTDLASAIKAVPSNIALQGNLAPELLLAGGAAMEAEARRIIAAMKDRPFIFNLGHGVMQPTPPEHVAALVSLVQA